MAGSDLELAARLRAYASGRAVRIASHLRIAIRPEALVLCPLGMAGEDTTIHAVAYGRLGGSVTILTVPDPRIRDDHYSILERLAADVQAYYEACRRAGTYPQFWTSSGAGADFLDVLADRFRFVQDNPRITRLGELLTYPAQRYPVAGQQALHTATRVLSQHFATGQQPSEDEHLQALLTWIRPLKGQNTLAAVALAEQIPMGIHTDPEFDRDVLAPLVGDYNAARRRGASGDELRRRALLIRQALEPVVRRIYSTTVDAISVLQGLKLQALPDLQEIERLEAGEFEFFMQGRDKGIHLPLRDSPKAAALKLAARMDVLDKVESAVMGGDQVGRGEAELRGDILTGFVKNPQSLEVGPYRVELRFDVVSTQRILRVRRGDSMCYEDDPRLAVVVTRVRRTGRITRVSMTVVKGMRAVGFPPQNSEVRFLPGVPDWESLVRSRIQYSVRLANRSWIHDPDATAPPSITKPRPPKDPLAAVKVII